MGVASTGPPLPEGLTLGRWAGPQRELCSGPRPPAWPLSASSDGCVSGASFSFPSAPLSSPLPSSALSLQAAGGAGEIRGAGPGADPEHPRGPG